MNQFTEIERSIYNEFKEIMKFFFLKIVPCKDYLSEEKQNSDIFLFPKYKYLINTTIKKYNESHQENKAYIFESFRSNKRQFQVWQSGSSQIKKEGMHLFCIATDIVGYENNKINWNLNYEALHNIASNYGLAITLPNDACHFQFISFNDQNILRTLYHDITKLIQSEYNLKIDGDTGKKTQEAILINFIKFPILLNNILFKL